MKYRIAFILSLAACIAPLQAQKRWYKDQKRESVILGDVRILGEAGQDRFRLSQRQAIEMALINNLGVNIERHRPLQRFWDIEANRAIYDSIIGFNFNWRRNKIPTGSVLAGGDSVTDIDTDYQFVFNRDLSTGTSLEFSFNGNRNRTTNSFASLVPSISTDFSLTLRQSLLQDFGRIDGDYEIEISRNSRQIADREFEASLSDTILRVQEAYWELEFALEDIDVKAKSLELAETILNQNQARLEVGSAARLEVVEAEAEVATRREELIRARFSYRLVQDSLVRLITSYQDPREFPGEIAPSDHIYEPAPIDQPFEDLMSEASAKRPELAQADLRIKNQSISLKRSRNRLKPQMDLVLGWQQFGLGGREIIRDFSDGFIDPPIIGEVPGGLGDSLDQLFGGDFYGYVLGVDFRLPLDNREARAENARAQIALDEEMLRKRDTTQQVALEIRDALTNLEMNRARVDAAQAAVRLGRERLDSQQARFDVGSSTTRELIEAQRDLVLNESLLIRNQVDLIISRNRLDRALGRSLEVHNIRLQEAIRTNVR